MVLDVKVDMPVPELLIMKVLKVSVVSSGPGVTLVNVNMELSAAEDIPVIA